MGDADHAKVPEKNTKDIVQLITDSVLYAIRSGKMVPGQHLVEADLTRQLGVSRGSLREGLKHLASEGLVKLTLHRGAFIAALDRKSVGDLLDVLELLCSLAARRAAESGAPDADKDMLKTLAVELGHSANGATSHGDYLTKRHQFYELLIAMGGNMELGRVIPLARADLFRAQFDRAQSRDQQKRHANGYLKIAEAVAANDPVKATKAVTKHFCATRETLATLPDHIFAANFSGV